MSERRSGAIPYLTVRGADAAIEFYRRAFAAEEVMRFRMPGDGRLGHATLLVNGAEVMVADEFPESVELTGTLAPASLGGTSAFVHMPVDDVDAWFDRALAAGATAVRAPHDEFFGRQGKLRDPFGHLWSLNGPKKG